MRQRTLLTLSDELNELTTLVNDQSKLLKRLNEIVREQQGDIIDIQRRLLNLSDGSTTVDKEPLTVVDGKTFYAVRDLFGRIVVDDEFMREFIHKAYGSSEKEGKQ